MVELVGNTVRRAKSVAQEMMRKPNGKSRPNAADPRQGCKSSLQFVISRALLSRGVVPGESLDIESKFFPGLKSAFQRTHSDDTSGLHQQRHPGATRLIRSRAIEHDLTIPGYEVMSFLELLQRDMQRTRYGSGIGRTLDCVTKIDDGKLLAGAQSLMQFLGADPRHPEIAQETATSDKFPHDVCRQTGDENHGHPGGFVNSI